MSTHDRFIEQIYGHIKKNMRFDLHIVNRKLDLDLLQNF